MCIIRYCGVSNSWWSTDGYKVKFNLKYPGWSFVAGVPHLRNEVKITIKHEVFNIWFWTMPDVSFVISKEDLTTPASIPVDVFEINRGHPAYDFFKKEMIRPTYKFFKKEMIRDDKVYLKPLDATENWQDY